MEGETELDSQNFCSLSIKSLIIPSPHSIVNSLLGLRCLNIKTLVQDDADLKSNWKFFPWIEKLKFNILEIFYSASSDPSTVEWRW